MIVTFLVIFFLILLILALLAWSFAALALLGLVTQTEKRLLSAISLINTALLEEKVTK